MNKFPLQRLLEHSLAHAILLGNEDKCEDEVLGLRAKCFGHRSSGSANSDRDPPPLHDAQVAGLCRLLSLGCLGVLSAP